MPSGTYVRTDEYRRRMSESKKGTIPWNKGKPRSAETKRKLSEALRGRKGRVQSAETRRKISESKKGKPSLLKGIPLSDEHKRSISEALKGKYTGSDHPGWRGGMHKRKRRNIELIGIFRSRSPDGLVRCYFCGKEIAKFTGRASDALVIHSLDENHENWESSNKMPAHLVCHLSFHNLGEKNHRWRGDAAPDSAKRRRRT